MKAIERKIQRKEDFRKLVLAKAHQILADGGLEELSMRAIAGKIGCSQSKIYEAFKDKNALCEALCAELCDVLLQSLRKIKQSKVNPQGYLKRLFITTLRFHEIYRHSDTLFTLVCYGGPQFSMPAQFVEIEKLFVSSLEHLQSTHLQNKRKITSALNAIRFLFIGAAQLSVYGVKSSQEIAIGALEDLMRGWMA